MHVGSAPLPPLDAVTRATGVICATRIDSQLQSKLDAGWTLVSRANGRSHMTVGRVVETLGSEPVHHHVIGPGLLTWEELVDGWRAGPDTRAIVACGGGTVLDASKVLRHWSKGSRPFHDAGFSPAAQPPLLVCVPTTCGSGSELTATVSLWDGGRKRALDHPSLRPACALYLEQAVGPRWDEPAIAAFWDAVSHALESLWNRSADSLSRQLAVAALDALIAGAAAPAPDWQRLQRGAALAGAAIALTRTAIAHALSYRLTARNACPHGCAAGLWALAIAPGMTEADATVRAALDAPASMGRTRLEALGMLWRQTGAARLSASYVSGADLLATRIDDAEPGRMALSAWHPDAAAFSDIKRRAARLLQWDDA